MSIKEEHQAIHYNLYKELMKERTKSQKLINALEFYAKDGGMVFSEQMEGPGWQPKYAREAIKEYKGDENG